MTAIAATSYTSRILVDGTLAMTIHIDPPFRDAAIALFGAPGSSMALAALQCAKAEPAPEPTKGGERAKWAALRCKDVSFHKWLSDNHPLAWGASIDGSDEYNATAVIYALCKVKSRAELDNDAAAAERFDRLIRRPYMAA